MYTEELLNEAIELTQRERIALTVAIERVVRAMLIRVAGTDKMTRHYARDVEMLAERRGYILN